MLGGASSGGTNINPFWFGSAAPRPYTYVGGPGGHEASADTVHSVPPMGPLSPRTVVEAFVRGQGKSGVYVCILSISTRAYVDVILLENLREREAISFIYH